MKTVSEPSPRPFRRVEAIWQWQTHFWLLCRGEKLARNEGEIAWSFLQSCGEQRWRVYFMIFLVGPSPAIVYLCAFSAEQKASCAPTPCGCF